MKYFFYIMICCFSVQPAFSQKSSQPYPVPDYSNEVYFFNKDSAKLLRLEKGTSKIQTKTKMGGMGGGENGYSLEGNRSPVRLKNGTNMYFVFFNGESRQTSPQQDSIMKANGMDAAAMSGGNGMMSMNDPSHTTSLYNMITEKGNRKITLQSYSGMKLFGKSKKESVKYTLSIKKVRDGYYEMLVDKPLQKGEYAFLLNAMGMGSMDGSSLMFAFGVD